MMSDPVLVAVIVGLLGPTIGALVHKWATHNKDDAELVGTVADQWKQWADEQGRRIAALEKRVSGLEEALATSESTNAKLKAQVAYQSKLLRSVVRWALTLKDELVRTGKTIPLMPADVETALTSLDIE